MRSEDNYSKNLNFERGDEIRVVNGEGGGMAEGTWSQLGAMVRKQLEMDRGMVYKIVEWMIDGIKFMRI